MTQAAAAAAADDAAAAVGTDLKERARTFAEAVARTSGLEVTASVASEEAEGITIAFDGPDARLLVGRAGQVLDALQYLASLAVNRRGGQRLRIIFDAAGYRARRAATLQDLAQELATQVKATGQEAVLDPLSPMERRIVHTALAEDTAVRTYSEGEEPDRYIIISPAAP
jgi:spoIIIJ-associated protein